MSRCGSGLFGLLGGWSNCGLFRQLVCGGSLKLVLLHRHGLNLLDDRRLDPFVPSGHQRFHAALEVDLQHVLIELVESGLDARRHIVLLGKMQAGHDEDESNQNRCRCTQSAANTLSGESYGDILAVHVVNEFRLHFDGGGQFAHLHSVQSEELGRCHTGFAGGEHQASSLVLRELADAAELGFALSQ